MGWIRGSNTSHFANRSYRHESQSAATQARLIKIQFYRSISKWLTDKQLRQLKPRDVAMFANGTGDIQRCGECSLYYVEAERNMMKYRMANMKKFGYPFRCMACRLKTPELRQSAERSELLQSIKQHISNEIDKFEGVQTTNN